MSSSLWFRAACLGCWDCKSLFFSLPRGHTVKAVCESFHLAKDAGFKVVAHMMPDLPNMGLERDIDQFVVSMAQDIQEFLVCSI